ncbi:MAG: hypothetical protein KME18_09375 [Phormidium tanganyikae FI6-MK23]|jgi:hypothetical protein|nr:hypothetical protein [Phormidium tanganyikae FI6-MK23]
MSALIINQKLLDDPFRVIYYKALESFDIHTLADRIEFLDRLADGTHQVENDIKNSTEQGGWLGIVSGFAAAMSIGAFVSLPILPVAVLGFMGATSAAVGIGNTVNRKIKLSPVQEELERHYLALRSTESINWAALWDYCHKSDQNGDETFRHLLFKASRGSISGDRLIRSDSTKEPFIAANKALASRQGRKAEEVATFVRAIKESFLNQQQKPIDSGWVPMPQPTDQPKAIGSETRLNAVEVPSQSVEVASVQRLTKQQVIALPLSDRAQYLMKLLAESGCDLRKLAGRSTLAAGGLQRSGKTTLIILLAILEKAMGQRIYYVTRDNDLYPVAFDGYANGSTANAVDALTVLSDRINNGSMNSLSGETWILDEFSSTAGELSEKTRFAFWDMALTGFAKQGGRVRFIVHHKTASANGLKGGTAETFKAEVKMFWTERYETESGSYQPSGQYELLQEVEGFYKSSGETFTIPDWLLTDTNPEWNNAPCPVRSLLEFFPEFDTRKGAKAEPFAKPKANPFSDSPQPEIISTREQLNRMLELPSAEHEVEEDVIETSSSLPEIRSAFPQWKPKSLEVASLIVNYLRKKSGEALAPSRFKADILKIKGDSSLTTDRLKEGLLPQLVSKGFLTEDNGRYSAAEDDYDF